jgi:hypothetical protein
MLIKILGLKISLELIILMLVIYLIMMVHTLASCCNAKAISEGFRFKTRDPIGPADKLRDRIIKKYKNKSVVESIIL